MSRTRQVSMRKGSLGFDFAKNIDSVLLHQARARVRVDSHNVVESPNFFCPYLSPLFLETKNKVTRVAVSVLVDLNDYLWANRQSIKQMKYT